MFKIISFFFMLLLFYSCNEYSKNKTRDDLGHCIPAGKRAVIENKWTSERGENFRVKYRILYDNSDCRGMITYHDYKRIKEGDTITRKSASTKCYKIYGQPCKNAIIEDAKNVTLIILILGILFGVYLGIKYYLSDFIESSLVGRLCYAIKDFIEDIIQVNFGIKGWIIVFLIAELILGKVISEFMQEIKVEGFNFISLLKMNFIITFVGVLLMLFNGFSRLHKNIMVLSLGIILLGGLMLFFYYVIGLDLTYMIKHALEKTSSS